ncbi:MAG TPA: MBL fold metallo-hydrolase, partial [Verrucomicrobiae bacterium]|nr:MBL fold metallo-hydrolase [Verrucomicrobiae bacterium]
MKANRLISILVGLLLPLAAHAGLADKTLDIYWVDVEGGAATLIVTPQNESVLIDAGWPGGRDSQRIYETATKLAGLKKIDYLITTHFH